MNLPTEQPLLHDFPPTVKKLIRHQHVLEDLQSSDTKISMHGPIVHKLCEGETEKHIWTRTNDLFKNKHRKPPPPPSTWITNYKLDHPLPHKIMYTNAITNR